MFFLIYCPSFKIDGKHWRGNIDWIFNARRSRGFESNQILLGVYAAKNLSGGVACGMKVKESETRRHAAAASFPCRFWRHGGVALNNEQNTKYCIMRVMPPHTAAASVRHHILTPPHAATFSGAAYGVTSRRRRCGVMLRLTPLNITELLFSVYFKTRARDHKKIFFRPWYEQNFLSRRLKIEGFSEVNEVKNRQFP